MESKSYLEIFKAKLRLLRKSRGLTQENLARDLKFHESYIGLLERGDRLPSIATLDKIARYFEVNLLDLFLDEDQAKKIGKKQRDIMMILDTCNDEELAFFYDMVKLFAHHIKLISKPKKKGK